MQSTKKKLIIIGGGAMGVSLLYHLAKLGWQNILLLEKNELTAGSTWHAAGLCTHFAHSPTIMQMRAHSVRLYSGELEKDTGLPVSFHQCGALRITRSEDRMDEFRQVQGLGEFMGYPFHIITPDDLKTLHPLTERGDGLIGGIHEPWDGYVDPSQATHAMAAGAKQRGAEIMRHTTVTAAEQTEQGHWRVETGNGLYECEILVNAAGTWCHDVGKMMGIDLPVVPMLHQYIVTDRVEAVAALDKELPMIRDPEESWYLRQERDGLIFGPYEKIGKPWSVDGVPPEFGMELLEPDYDALAPIMELAMQRVPALESAGIKTVVHGPITFTPDAAPLIGPAFGLENAWLLTGSSMGVMEGGGAGHFLAQWLDSGSPPDDAQAVDPRRYGAYADREFRIAKATECFGRQFAIHFPHEQLPAARDLRLSPLHDTWLGQHAVMGAAYGWERPEYFSTDHTTREHHYSFRHTNAFPEVARECRVASESVAFCDLTLFSKFEVTGPGSTEFLGSLGVNTLPAVGRIGLLHVLAANGGVEMEFTVTRLADEHYYLTAAAAAERGAWDVIKTPHPNPSPQGRGAKELWATTNLTNTKAILGVFGPQAIELLQAVIDIDLSQESFPWLTAKNINIAGHDLLALRLSYIGEAGLELHMPREAMPTVYRALQETADSMAIKHAPIGMLAVNAMRLEKGYPVWGMDLTTERTPLESGLHHFVKTDNREFVGKTAMLEREDQQPWRMVLLAIDNADGPAFGGQPVYLGEEIVGIVTSGAYGHRAGRNLALAYLLPSPLTPQGWKGLNPPETPDLTVKILGTQYSAQILQEPPYDPDNERLKA